jgi:acyl dehydratase
VGPFAHEWREADAILYSLGIGARLPGDLPFLYEHHAPDGLAVEPTFALSAVTRLLPPLVEALGLDLRALLHAAQALEVHRVPPAAGRCTVTRAITGVWDKGSAAIVDCEDQVADAEGPLATARSRWWVRGAGGFGGPGRPADDGAPPPAPQRPADWRHVVATTPEQAALHRLSGDRNPVHIDPALAREAGQPAPFLHGLCTFGLTGHALDRAAGPGRRLASLGGRFTRPVFPGQALTVEAWWTGDGARVRVHSPDGVVLDRGEAAFAEAA